MNLRHEAAAGGPPEVGVVVPVVAGVVFLVVGKTREGRGLVRSLGLVLSLLTRGRRRGRGVPRGGGRRRDGDAAPRLGRSRARKRRAAGVRGGDAAVLASVLDRLVADLRDLGRVVDELRARGGSGGFRGVRLGAGRGVRGAGRRGARETFGGRSIPGRHAAIRAMRRRTRRAERGGRSVVARAGGRDASGRASPVGVATRTATSLCEPCLTLIP